jgi:hypothetical protein
MDSGFCVDGVAALRLLHYPPQRGGPPRIGAGAHTGTPNLILHFNARFRSHLIVNGGWRRGLANLEYRNIILAGRQTCPR